MKKLVVLALIALILLFGCTGGSEGANRIAKATLPDGFAINSEVADTAGERATGLMWRTELCENCGMLFVFENEGVYPFWMKNTKIPLDIIYIGGDMQVVDIWGNAQPCQTDPCQNYQPKAKAKYVLEVNAGIAEKHGVTEGGKIGLFFNSG